MNKIAIVACSTSGIDYVKEASRVEVARMTLQLNGKEYIDYLDITAEDFYDKMTLDPNATISTSQVSTGKFLEKFEELKDKGITDIIVITVSSKLSGTIQSAKIAADMLEGVSVHIIDSKSVSFGELALVIQALELIDKNYTVSEIINVINEAIHKIKIYVVVDTLKYLVKNGRLSATAGLLGSLLKIKPILSINEIGELKPFEKVRTSTKAQQRVLELIEEETRNKEVHYFIAYTNNLEKANEVKDKLLKINKNSSVTIFPLTPVVGAHAGPGTLGIGYLIK